MVSVCLPVFSADLAGWISNPSPCRKTLCCLQYIMLTPFAAHTVDLVCRHEPGNFFAAVGNTLLLQQTTQRYHRSTGAQGLNASILQQRRLDSKAEDLKSNWFLGLPRSRLFIISRQSWTTIPPSAAPSSLQMPSCNLHWYSINTQAYDTCRFLFWIKSIAYILHVQARCLASVSQRR